MSVRGFLLRVVGLLSIVGCKKTGTREEGKDQAQGRIKLKRCRRECDNT